jgi:hypothetical protein
MIIINHSKNSFKKLILCLFHIAFTGRHDIAEILLKVALKHQKSNQSVQDSLSDTVLSLQVI